MTKQLWAPWRLEYIKQADEREGCFFCAAAEGRDEEGLVVHRGERAFVLLNKFPYSSGHLLVAPFRHIGDFGELDSQLFDVAPNGSERLISRGAYRLTDNQAGTITFQLHGNGYAFPSGDQVKLVLLGRDAPYLRASNNPAFAVTVSKLTVILPTR